MEGVLLHGHQKGSELAVLQGLKVGATVWHEFANVYYEGHPVALSREKLEGGVGGGGMSVGGGGRKKGFMSSIRSS